MTKRQRTIDQCDFRYRDDNPYHQYLKEKGRDVPKPQCTPVGDAIRRLDIATIHYLNGRGTLGAVDDAFEAVLKIPGNTWTREQLNYRQRQEHFK